MAKYGCKDLIHMPRSLGVIFSVFEEIDLTYKGIATKQS